jgi:hypothetical protein
MGARPLDAQVVVLERAASGESWFRLLCFSVEHGNLNCLQRRSRRAAAVCPLLDLFDEAQLILESSNEGRTWFIREAAILRRHPALGRSYETLRCACRFAHMVAGNPVAEESRPSVGRLLERAIAAWEAGARPDAVYFKSVFLLAREEGYPVHEDWRAGLSADDQRTVTAILRESSSSQSSSSAEVARLAAALESYIRTATDLHIAD